MMRFVEVRHVEVRLTRPGTMSHVRPDRVHLGKADRVRQGVCC